LHYGAKLDQIANPIDSPDERTFDAGSGSLPVPLRYPLRKDFAPFIPIPERECAGFARSRAKRCALTRVHDGLPMRSREISLEELERLQRQLTLTLIQLRVLDKLPTLVGLLMNIGGYVTTHVHRIREWGAREHIDDLDLIGYSTRCIFEANLMLKYYGTFQSNPQHMYDVIRGEVDRDDFDILDSVVAFHGAAAPEIQPLFGEHARRKQSKYPRTPNFSEIATRTGAQDEYKSFYKLYSKYAHPSAYLLMADRRHVWAAYVRDVFLDRAVLYAEHCATVMDMFLRKSIEESEFEP
jgi:hypothetical protein